MIYLTLLILPLFVIVGFFIFSNHKITWKEFLIQTAIQCLIAGISIGIIYSQNLYDVEIWNGQVTSKTREKVHCRHSYRCHCVEVCTGSGEDESCHEVCQTCYDHDYDVDWKVYTNINHIYYIDTLDRQGLKEPPKWTQVKIGEPVALSKSFLNYIKASSDTLFRKKELKDEYFEFIPKYPNNIYDYYKLDRILQIKTNINNINEWNNKLSYLNGELGPIKESNIVLLFTSLEKEYSFSLEQYWIGGKKNDIIIVTGIEDLKIKWINIISWCENDIFKIKLRDSLLSLEEINVDKFLLTIKENVLQYYKRKSFKNFKYLVTSVTPTFTQWIVSMVLGLLCSLGISIYMYSNEFETTKRR